VPWRWAISVVLSSAGGDDPALCGIISGPGGPEKSNSPASVLFEISMLELLVGDVIGLVFRSVGPA
jgi:hypothetical protein